MIHKPSYRDKQTELSHRRWGIGGLEKTLRRVNRNMAPLQAQLTIVTKTPGTPFIKYPTWRIIKLVNQLHPEQRAYILLPRLRFNILTETFEPVFVARFDAVAYHKEEFIEIIDRLIELSKAYAL